MSLPRHPGPWIVIWSHIAIYGAKYREIWGWTVHKKHIALSQCHSNVTAFLRRCDNSMKCHVVPVFLMLQVCKSIFNITCILNKLIDCMITLNFVNQYAHAYIYIYMCVCVCGVCVCWGKVQPPAQHIFSVFNFNGAEWRKNPFQSLISNALEIESESM